MEDTCEGVIKFESGATGNFYATTSFHGKDSTLVYILTKNHKIELDIPKLRVDGVEIDLGKEREHVGKECYGNGHFILINKFYEALLNGEEMPVTVESAQYAVRILLAAYKSDDKEIPI